MPETRARPCFAWLPVRLSDGSWVHLHWYTLVERFDPEYIDETQRGFWFPESRHRER